jgi:hypothetical protein
MGALVIERVSVDWFLRYANDPRLCIDVTGDGGAYNPYTQVVHHPIGGDGLWLATDDPWSHFIIDRSERDRHLRRHAKGAATGTLNTIDGPLEITSGWSSRAGVVNSLIDDHVVDCTVRGSYGGARGGLAIRREAVLPLLPDGVFLVEVHGRDGEVRWVPSLAPDAIVKPETVAA